ncbi:MAG: 50S ribosomal protein L21 [Verrucomicrobiota bacterium]
MLAVIRTGSKQYKIQEGDILDVELLPLKEGEKSFTISDVLLVADGANVKVGKPLVSGAQVTVEIQDEIKGDKVIAYKFRRREGYHRTVGHRQKYNRVKVTKIQG